MDANTIDEIPFNSSASVDGLDDENERSRFISNPNIGRAMTERMLENQLTDRRVTKLSWKQFNPVYGSPGQMSGLQRAQTTLDAFLQTIGHE